MRQKRWWLLVMVGAAVLGLGGCGAKHTIGDKVIYDPESEETEQAEQPQKSGKGDQAVEAQPAEEQAAADPEAEGPTEPTKPEPQAGQFVEAEGTSFGTEDWVAEIHGEGDKLWLVSPYDPATTYAAVRAATFLQGLRMKEEHFDQRRFTTTLGYHSWHPESEGGMALTMKVLTKGFGKDARYRFRVAVEGRPEGGSRVEVHQYREVMEEEPHQDVGDWVEADGPKPEITRKYLEGVQRALGD